MPWILAVLLFSLFLLVPASARLGWLRAVLLSLLLLALSSWYLINGLSGDGINAATVYHLKADMQGAGVQDFSSHICIFVVMVLGSLLLPAMMLRARRLRWKRHRVVAASGFVTMLLLAVLISPLYADGKRIWYQLRPVDYAGVVPEYELPQRPLQRRKNIVWIYGESLERTYFDQRVFPGLTPNLQRLASQGLDFRQLASAEGSGWTIAGLVASQCGVPLTAAPGDENSMGRMGRFLPEARCLGDYLKSQGYRNEFYGGASAEFAGKGRFLASHGYDVIRDQDYFRKQRKVAAEHFSVWGVHDDVLLEEAWQRFQQLSRAGQPFMLNTLTMDTHHPAGHLPLACKDQHYQSQYGRIGLLDAIKCSDRLIGELVERIRSSRYANNTIVVIGSDHLAMPNDLSHILVKQQRENLLLVLGSGIAPRQVTASAGSTLDSGATVLQLLEPNLHTLGFGRSLLADNVTPSASAAALREHGKDYPPYLAFARTLWTGKSTRTLKVDNGQVLVGVQQVTPPVLLEYDQGWELKSVYLENTSRTFDSASPRNAFVYVDRCTAFEDAAGGGEWCALLLDRNNGTRYYHDNQLRRGIAVDAPPDGKLEGPRPRVRQPIMLTSAGRKAAPGQYMLEMYARRLPQRAFWVEAVSSRGNQVLAQQWVSADASGYIRMPVGVQHAVDDLEIRAWLDYTEDLAVDELALVPARRLRNRS
jgi:phosphoglycerol transferase